MKDLNVLTEPVGPEHPYWMLQKILMEAFQQASEGKGKERHAEKDERFEDQQICEITRRCGMGFPLGQAVKKIQETKKLDTSAKRIHELLGAINYIAAAILVDREKYGLRDKGPNEIGEFIKHEEPESGSYHHVKPRELRK